MKRLESHGDARWTAHFKDVGVEVSVSWRGGAFDRAYQILDELAPHAGEMTALIVQATEFDRPWDPEVTDPAQLATTEGNKLNERDGCQAHDVPEPGCDACAAWVAKRQAQVTDESKTTGADEVRRRLLGATEEDGT